MKKINQKKLANIFASVSGAKFCTIVTETDPKLKKTNNPFENVIKRTRMNVTLNFIYENSVNNQRAKEGSDKTFEAMPRKWGQRVPHTCLVTHNNNLYIEVKPNGAPQSVEYIDNNGVQIDKALLQEFLPTKSSNAAHQGVEKEVIVRDYKLDSIKELIIDKEHYIVVA